MRLGTVFQKSPLSMMMSLSNVPSVILLNQRDNRCTLYSSAEAFLDESELPYCAVVDYHLPGLNLDLQRRMNEKGHPIPIIMISAHDDRVRAKAIEQGAGGFSSEALRWGDPARGHSIRYTGYYGLIEILRPVF
jgi:hypothetical protein